MQEVARRISLFSATTSTILITGETGTGKEVVARTIHAESARACGPFVAVNCAAIPGALLEAELFGYERGAFTGAVARHPGRFEQASGGTLFLDEVGDMSLVLQAKLLRVLQEREVEHLGGSRPIPIDIRVLAATNRDLHHAIATHAFREDLYYRVAGVTIHLPPLRERAGLDRLAEHFLQCCTREAGLPTPTISQTAQDWLRSHSWPGNIRQLRSVIECAAVMCGGESIEPHHLS
ncbi:MAG TPA: sigma 54-interacting transcriptional regulator, partial [Longimicrobiaceae bacterium]|nr:sigma 54-interacting transcriptional regulator [Longimicrobiaceae bacterium]